MMHPPGGVARGTLYLNDIVPNYDGRPLPTPSVIRGRWRGRLSLKRGGRRGGGASCICPLLLVGVVEKEEEEQESRRYSDKED